MDSAESSTEGLLSQCGDIEIAVKVWGPNISVLKGKTVRSQPGPVKLDLFQIPKEIRDLHKQATLSIDIFYVNKIPFLVTLSRVLCFMTSTLPYF